MSLRYTRRPILGGNARELIQAQPSIRGSIRRSDATLQFPGMALPADMSIKIDGGAAIPLSFSGLVINTIIADINTALGAVGSAEDRGGYVVILSNASGDGASVEIVDAGGNDASALLGFPVSPDPLALVEGGDRAYSPAGGSENNPVGTYMAADGEDVTSDVLNRVAGALSVNADYLNACLEREVALPMIVEVDSVAVGNPWLPARIKQSDGNIDQINVGGLSAINAGLSDRVYLGIGLDNQDSSLQDIADYFAVTDPNRVEIIVGGYPVRVSAVTHGQRNGAPPNFGSSDTDPPIVAMADSTAPWLPADGKGLLGVNVKKTASVGISEILYRSAIRCAGATFLTDGVVPGDVATISGSTVNVPFNHDGSYTVEQVFDEKTILLRPTNAGDRGELNPGTGVFGNVEIFQGGLFSEDVWLTFDPPIPATAGAAKFTLMLGGGYSLCSLPTDHLLRIALSTSEEVDDLVQKVIREMKGPLLDSTDDFTQPPFAHTLPGGNGYAGEADVTMELLWRRISLQGAYDGQGRGGGGGYFVNVDWNAPEWNNLTPKTPQAGTSNRTGVTATIQAGNVVYITGENFSLDDVGREFMVIPGGIGGSLRNYQSFCIIDYLDAEHVVVEPGENNPAIPTGGSYSYSIMQDRFNGFPASMSTHVLQSNSYGRLGYVHEEDRVAGREYGHHMLGLRECGTHEDAAALPMDVFDVEFAGGDNSVTFPAGMNPTTTSNIRAFEDDVKDPSITPSIIRITEGQGNDGWYVVNRIAGVPLRVYLQNFDGTRPNFDATSTARGHLYLPTQGFALLKYLVADGYAADLDVRIANLFFDDAKEWSDDRTADSAHMGVVGIDWRGTSSGIVMRLNDPDLLSKGLGLGLTRGPATDIATTEPARGFLARHYGDSEDADTVKRGGWAGALIADTYSMDGTKASPSMMGTALYLAQVGTDSAFVAVGWQTGGAHADLPNPDDITFVDGKATGVIVREDRWSMMQGGALEIMGGVYQWDPRISWPDGENLHEMYGGTYSELSSTSRFSNSPMSEPWMRYWETNHDVAREGNPAVLEERISARLGQPGRVLPYRGTGGHLCTIEAPDAASSRSARTSGFVRFYTHPGTPVEDPSAFVGQIARLYDLAGANAAKAGDYVIVNVSLDESITGLGYRYHLFEVYHPDYVGATALTADASANQRITVLGNRWHWANLDIESWFTVGTYMTATPGEDPDIAFKQLGAFGRFLDKDSKARDMAGYPMGLGPNGPLSPPTLFLNDYAAGMSRKEEALLGALQNASRPPIANQAWHPLYEPLDLGDLGDLNFNSSEWVFRDNGVGGTFRLSTDFKDPDNLFDDVSEPLGAILLNWSNGTAEADPETLHAYTGGARWVRQRHFRIRVKIGLRWSGTQNFDDEKTISVALVGQNFAPWNEAAPAQTFQLLPDVTTFTELFFDSPDDLREAAADALSDGTPVMVRLGLGQTWMRDVEHEAGTGEEKLFIYSLVVDTEAVDVHHGVLVNEGPVLAAGFSIAGTAMDYKSYGPESAECYSEGGYGDEVPWDDRSRTYGATVTGDEGKISPPNMAFLAGRRVLHLDGEVKLTGENFLDLADPYLYWRRGKHSACFNFVHDRFMPQSPLDDGLGCFPPMVGHIIRLDPPHGSILSSLTVGFGYRPGGKDVEGSWTPDGGIFYGTSCTPGGMTQASASDIGFLLELHRYWVSPTENAFDEEREVGAAVVSSIAHGFSEVILSKEVDIPWMEGVAPTTKSIDQKCDGNEINQDVRTDRQYLLKLDLHEELYTEVEDPQVTVLNPAHVDRRQFSYALVLRCWGKGGGVNQDVNHYLVDNPDGTSGMRIGLASDISANAASATVFTAVKQITRFKFLGATLGCQYNRINP